MQSITWRKVGDKVIGSNGAQYTVHPSELWYVVPSRTDYKTGERLPRPLEFALTLHNASIGKGLIPSPTVMGDGTELKTLKGGVAAQAESLLEQVRTQSFPHLPSRLRCYFLNSTKEVAEYRMRDTLRGEKRLVRCYAIRDHGKFHLADTDLYERLEGRPDDAELAKKYWAAFHPKNKQEERKLEILADGALYFPDWQTFPQLRPETLLEWQKDWEASNQP